MTRYIYQEVSVGRLTKVDPPRKGGGCGSVLALIVWLAFVGGTLYLFFS